MKRETERFSALRRVNEGLRLENKRLKELLRAVMEIPDQILTADLQREKSAALGRQATEEAPTNPATPTATRYRRSPARANG